MLNLSIRFGKKGWQNIATGLETLSTIGQSVIDSDQRSVQHHQNSDSHFSQNESNGSFEKSRNKKEKRNQEQYTNLSSTNRLLRGKEDNYRYYKDEINKLKAPSSYQYKGLTYKEKKEKVKEYQKMMKEKREEYESISGKSLICADVSLENWNPSEDDLMEKCTHCGGDGKCISCARRGNGKCSNCGGSGYLDIERIGCPNCDTPGNGKCKSCGGTGKCPTCHGKAKF